MANFKVGNKLMCIKDYNNSMKQGVTGVIIKENEGFMTWDFDISYLDGREKICVKGADMEKYFVII